MTRDQAFAAALRRSRANPLREYFVVREDQDDGTLYDVADDYQLDTYYAGAPVELAFFGGRPEQAG